MSSYQVTSAFPVNGKNGSFAKSSAVLQDLEVFNCRICFELPKAEIYQCCRGHSICGKCVIKLSSCPTCNVPYYNGKIRNYLAEDVLANLLMNCSSKGNGCPEGGFNRQQLTDHEELCSYNPDPIKLCHVLFNDNCSYEISRVFMRTPAISLPTNWRDHLRAKHYSNTPIIMKTAVSGTAVTQLHGPSCLSSLDNGAFNTIHGAIQHLLKNNESRDPIGLFMLWAHVNPSVPQFKQISWFFVRLTDKPQSGSVSVKFNLKSNSTDKHDDPSPSHETTWNGEIMSLADFREFKKKPENKLKFSLPLNHIRQQYLNAEGGLDLHFTFTVTPSTDKCSF